MRVTPQPWSVAGAPDGPVSVSWEVNPGGWLPSGTGSAPLMTHSLSTVTLAGSATWLYTVQDTAVVVETSTLKPVVPEFVTGMLVPPSMSVQTAFCPETGKSVEPSRACSVISTVPLVTPE